MTDGVPGPRTGVTHTGTRGTGTALTGTAVVTQCVDPPCAVPSTVVPPTVLPERAVTAAVVPRRAQLDVTVRGFTLPVAGRVRGSVPRVGILVTGEGPFALRRAGHQAEATAAPAPDTSGSRAPQRDDPLAARAARA
ncbi:hypothetical protein, partial [Streptomyces sp. SolWspMP-5a-2]|uniref:hypothetical protein n=1 Tax=Streptomyces sp. SID4950 TaxID=2690288 RepID=UPI00081B32A8